MIHLEILLGPRRPAGQGNYELEVGDALVIDRGYRVLPLQRLQRPFALLLPDGDAPALEVAAEFGEHITATPGFTFKGKHSRQMVPRLGCRYDCVNLFISLYRLLEGLFAPW